MRARTVFPKDWNIKTLAELPSRITDGEHLTPDRTSSGHYLLSARNVLNGRIDVQDVDYVGDEEFYRIRARCNPEPGDVLLSCSGTIGRVALVPPKMNCVLVRSAALIKPCLSNSNGSYLQYWLQSWIIQE